MVRKSDMDTAKILAMLAEVLAEVKSLTALSKSTGAKLDRMTALLLRLEGPDRGGFDAADEVEEWLCGKGVH